MLEVFEPLILLFILVAMDFATGVIGAICNGVYNSSKMRQGLLHALTYVFAIALAIILQEISKFYDLGLVYTTALYALVYIWIVLTETGSILENLVKINPALADNKFMSIFANQAKDEQTKIIENKAQEQEAEEEPTRKVGKHEPKDN
jgi:toxin secretion/phage lysis holin